MTELDECKKNGHALQVIYVDARDPMSETVVRWCKNCGGVVVDTDFDGRTNPGAIMKMQFPVAINKLAINKEEIATGKNLPIIAAWIDMDGFSVRVVVGGDANNIADRMAFIEDTPRIRIAPYTEKDDYKNWKNGNRGAGCQDIDSREWCDNELVELGYTLKMKQ